MQQIKSDAKTVQRNKRMFGALVGTLERFSKEEVKKKSLLDKKKKVEEKVEEKTEREKEELKQKRRELFEEEKKTKHEIKIIEVQMRRMEEFETWEKSKLQEANYIRTTKSDVNIYWLPKAHSKATKGLLAKTRDLVDREVEERKNAFKEELVSIEQKMKDSLERRRREEEQRRNQQQQQLQQQQAEDGEDDEFMAGRRVVERDDREEVSNKCRRLFVLYN